jgi:aminotransferase MxcL
MPNYTLWKRQQDCIAQGALTNSKHPDRHVMGVYPTHAYAGYGSQLVTPDGVYQDYICGLGANLFGYSNPKIMEAVKDALGKGFSHSLPTIFEIETAEKLKQLLFFVERWKFLKSGSEACNASIKMARAYQESKGRIIK